MDLVLVHGSFHGAWCWERLIPARRRTAIAWSPWTCRSRSPAWVRTPMRLSSARPSKASAAAPPAIVGHSMAGLVVPLVAARRPIDRLIFLAAFLPHREGAPMTSGRPSPSTG